jgi:hypothetical protein
VTLNEQDYYERMTTLKSEADISMDRKQKLVQFRAPEALSSVIDKTASKNFQTRSEYIRRSIVERLKADGVVFEAVSTAQT